MDREISNKSWVKRTILALLFFIGAQPQIVFCRDIIKAQRLNELKRLRDELKLTDSLRDADVTVILSEHAIGEAARQIEDLEILTSNDVLLRVTSADVELKPAVGIVKIGVRAKSSVTVNLLLTGRLGVGEMRDDAFQMPFQITSVSLASNPVSSLYLKALLGAWLSPKKWNEELPPLEIPLEVAETMQIPAGRFNAEGSPPMEISTPEYRSPLKFTVASLFVLDKRLVLGLQMADREAAENSRNVIRASYPALKDKDIVALENEVAELSDNLTSNSDLLVRLHRRVISRLLEQIAAAHKTDFTILLKPGRVRAEEIDAVVKVVNYTDVEGGDGRADVSHLSIDRIADGKVNLRLSGQGEADARLRGREYGVPYRLSPHTTFSIRDSIITLQFVSEGERVILRAMPGASLPINLRFSIKVAGRDIGINRRVTVEVDRWLNRIEIPSFFGREAWMPRRMEIDAGGNLHVTRRQKMAFTLSKMRVEADNDAVIMTADAMFSRQ